MDTEQQLAEIKDLVLQTHQRLEHLERKTDDITVQLKEVDNRLNEFDNRFNEVDKRFNEFDNRFREFDIRIDTYQKASQQVVNLAFGLIVAATAAIVIPAITNR